MTVPQILRALSLLLLLAVSATAEAKPYRFPDPVQFGLFPAGFQIVESRGSTLPAYRAGADLAFRYGRIAKGYHLWFGVGSGWSPLDNVAGSVVHDVRVDLFAHLSFSPEILEAPSLGLTGLKKQPLHTYVRAGVSGDLQFAAQPISRAVGLRIGAGAAYFFSDHVGIDANLGAMVGLGQNASGNLGLTMGNFDLLVGLRFGPGKKPPPKKKGGGQKRR